MSMISAQCDELRWLADHLEETDSHMDEYVRAMRQAADTIWELRCKLAGVVDQSDEIDRLKAENNRLRKMVEAVLQCTGVAKRDKGCDACPMYDKSKAISIKSEWCRLRPTLREMGIEVDG